MTKILILNPDPDEWEMNAAHHFLNVLKDHDVEIVNVCKGETPTNFDYDKFIVPGSATSCYEELDWLRKLEDLIRKIHSIGKPLLGVCFGHQAIAKALGGEVVFAGSREFGPVHMLLTEEGVRSPLFKNISNNFLVLESHQDKVIKIPEGAVLLVENDFCIQSFSIGNTFCVQFHPEMTVKTARILGTRYGKDLSVLDIFKDSHREITLKVINNFIEFTS
ncbi:type 1 glutamine amidotransferase [Candidatus Woesearchaeota archaeon]|nr:type 1 glutamine amidotransferase [Candidatus Woesearchaeota archaeon]